MHARGDSETSERRSSVRGHVVQRHVRPFDTLLHPPLLPFDIKILLLHYLCLLAPLFLVNLAAGREGNGVGLVVGWNLTWYVRRCPFLLISFFILQGTAFYKTQKAS